MTICKRCMAQYDEKYGVCPRCGEPFVPQINLAQSNQAAGKKSKNLLIAIISISGIILVGVVIVLIMIFSQPNTNSELSEQISLGEKYLTEENYDEAIVAFKKAIQIDPNDPQLYIQLADAYIGKGDKDSAVETLENGYKTTGSEEIKKKLDELKNEIEYEKYISNGNNELSNKKYDKAIENFEKANKLMPTKTEAYIGAGNSYIAKDDIENAKIILNKGYEKTKDEKIKKMLDELNNNYDRNIQYKAYLKIVKELINKYGEGKYLEKTSECGGVQRYLSGLSVIRLLDFDGDGKEELLCGYYDKEDLGNGQQQIYSFDGEKANLVYYNSIPYSGQIFQSHIELIKNNEKIYILTKENPQTFIREIWSELIDGKITQKVDFNGASEIDGTGRAKYKIDGQYVDETTFFERLDSFHKSGESIKIPFNEDSRENLQMVLSETDKVLEMLGYCYSSEYNYKEILNMFSSNISNSWYENNNINYGYGIENIGINSVSYMWQQYYGNLSSSEVGYSFIDLNNDGVDELLISPVEQFNDSRSKERCILDLYTIIDGEVVHLASSGERSRYFIGNDYTICHHGSGGA